MLLEIGNLPTSGLWFQIDSLGFHTWKSFFEFPSHSPTTVNFDFSLFLWSKSLLYGESPRMGSSFHSFNTNDLLSILDLQKKKMQSPDVCLMHFSNLEFNSHFFVHMGWPRGSWLDYFFLPCLLGVSSLLEDLHLLLFLWF